MVVLALISGSALAGAKMGNYDRAGSRSVPGASGLDKAATEAFGFEVKWSAMTDGSVASSAVTSGKSVLVADMNGKMYSFDADDGSLLWETCLEVACDGPGFPFAGIIGSPLVPKLRRFFKLVQNVAGGRIVGSLPGR